MVYYAAFMSKMQLYIRHAMALAAFVALVWGFRLLIFEHAPGIFSAPEEDMSYAWYVPLFSLYVLWAERKELLASIGASGWGAFALMVPSLAIGFLGARGLQIRFEIIAFVGLLIATVWGVYGRKTAAKALFPALFLLFCIPLNSFLDVVTVHLRLFASSTAFFLLKGVGADVIRQGTMIGAADGSYMIDIAEPCSGLRSIFALTALTAGYAYFNQRTWLKRAVLFASSVPIAIAGNVARILSICLVASFADKDFATGFYHDYSGYVVFIVAILLMVAFGEVLSRIGAGGQPSAPPSAAPPAPPAPDAIVAKRSLAIPALMLAILIPAMIYQASSPKVTIAEPPQIVLPEIDGFEFQELEPSESELTVLPADTRFVKRLYTAADGRVFQVSVVIGGAGKSSIHRPELCLPSQGYLMREARTVKAGGTDWRFITVETGPSARIGFAYTFFNQAGFKTNSHMRRIMQDVWDRSVLNRVDRWIMVTVNSSIVNDAVMSEFIERLGVVK